LGYCLGEARIMVTKKIASELVDERQRKVKCNSSSSCTLEENQMGNCGADDRVAAAGDGNDDDDGVYKRCCKVGVIGAGAGGLVTARELIREGHSVVVFEKSMTVGGVWVYEPEVDSELLGVKSDRKRVHSSMYASLRTNLPRELMSYVDYPFLPRNGRRDGRRYPGHQEVAFYLQDFAQECELLDFIRFGVSVEHVELEMDRPDGEISWKVTTRRRVVDGFEEVVEEEVFDAVVVCSGHFSEPRIADIPGIDTWPGKEMHSHNYRDPQSFTDKVPSFITLPKIFLSRDEG
jgi:cation diffusion facilitator CzcD-associated flavoprotein CzcO